jgi:hypothetical protein
LDMYPSPDYSICSLCSFIFIFTLDPHAWITACIYYSVYKFQSYVNYQLSTCLHVGIEIVPP